MYTGAYASFGSESVRRYDVLLTQIPLHTANDNIYHPGGTFLYSEYWSTEVIATVGSVTHRHYAVVGGPLTILGAGFMRATHTGPDLQRNVMLLLELPHTEISVIRYKRFSQLLEDDAAL